MAAALEEITRQIKEETRVAILEQIKIIRSKPTNYDALDQARQNLKNLIEVDSRINL